MNKLFLVLFLLSFSPLLHAQDNLFKIEKLPEFINSAYDEITPVPSRDGNTLYFTRVAYPEFNRYLFLDSVDLYKKYPAEKYERLLRNIYSDLSGKPVRDPAASPFNQDVWIAEGDSAEFWLLRHPLEPLNNALPNSIVTITPDPNTFYCLNQFSPKGDMTKGFSLIRRVDSLWTFPVPIEIKEYYTITSDVNLTMSFDGKILILSAVRHDSRDLDLYVCFREGENQWSAPQHLGNVINSDKRETTPYLSEDNTTLYFASNRWPSLGGSNDIFMSKRLDDSWKKWSTPEPLDAPINSPFNESQPYFNMTSGYLYFTSWRDGSSDIFRMRIAPPQPTEFTIRGRIFNRKTHELMPNARVFYRAPDAGLQNSLSSADGFFTLTIPRGVRFELTPEKAAFAGQTEEVLFRRDYYFFQEYYQIDLWLDPLEVNDKIELKPIYFQQSKAIILESSYPELERLAQILRENATLEIRIEGHTDNVGKAEDLLRLSEDRAKALRNFLMEKGIAGSRIQTVGFGPKFPISDNSTDELRAQNRRVEIRITKI